MKKLNRECFLMPVVETRMLEKRLLTREQFETMLKAKEFGQIHAILQRAGYHNFPTAGVRERDIHAMLHDFLSDFLEEILAISPPDGTEYLDLLFLDYDLHNIQAVLMRQHEGEHETNSVIPLPRERSMRYRALLHSGQPDCDDFYARLLYGAREKYSQGPRALQEWLDQEYFKRLLAVADASGVALFVEYAQTKIDFYNILSLLRLRRLSALFPEIEASGQKQVYGELIASGGTIPKTLLMELFPLRLEDMRRMLDQTKYSNVFPSGMARYGDKQDISVLERDMDNYLTRLVRSKQYTPFGPEPLFNYLYARRIEVTNLRLVLAVRLQGLAESVARERMREEYV